MSDLLRQNFQGGSLGRLSARKAEHLKMRGGGIDNTGKYKRRLSSWAEISIEGSFPIKMNPSGFKGRYDSNNKPSTPSLTKVSIKRLTSFAQKLNLTLEVDVEFEIFTKEVFETYAAQYLRRHPQRKSITIRWGNTESYNGRGKTSHSLTGAMVLAGSFTNTELNVYKCSFKAIAPASAILHLDMLSHDPLENIFPGQSFQYGVMGWSKEGVGSLIKKMIYDLQQSGTQLTKSFPDGFEPSSPDFGIKVGKIYQPFDGSPAGNKGIFGDVKRLFNGDEKSGVDSDANEYVSLEYIVKLIDRVVIRNAKDKCNNQINFKIKFSDQHYSYVPQGFRSGNPLYVLFLDGGTAGNYEMNGRGKNFEVMPGTFAGCISGDRLDHKKILISRRAAIQSLLVAVEKNDNKNNNKDNIKNGDIEETILSLNDYFKDLFQIISRASGNFVNLTFSLDLDAIKEGGSKNASSTVVIVDARKISNPNPQIHTLDPIRGDGSCINVTVNGKLPDDLTALALLPGTGRGSEVSANYSNDTALANLAVKKFNLLVKLTSTEVQNGIFAKMANDDFSEASIQEACQTLTEYNKLTTIKSSGFKFVEYFDVELKAEMDGIFPIIIGNLFSSTNLPKFARPENKVAFVCLDVEDVIEAPNIWTTNISCRLTPLQ